MPIYEYKCPNGHHFESFHGMTEPGPVTCEVCSAEPLERVLFPVAVHYKGSGFYSTDYGKGARKGKDSGGGEAGSSSDGGSSSDSTGSSPYTPEIQKKVSEAGGGSTGSSDA